jgi:hypothetical protein
MIDPEHTLTDEDFERAKQNGISRDLLKERFYRLFWDKEDCITEPVRKYDDYNGWRKECKRLGVVSVFTFDERVKRGWDIKEAATTPTLTKEEIAERVRAGAELRRKYPDWVDEKIKEIGITKRTFYTRMNKQKWTFEEAVTVPKGVRLADWRLRDYKSS